MGTLAARTSEAIGRNALELLQPGEVDQMLGRGQPELHHRNEAMSAGDRAGVLAEFIEQAHGLGDGGWSMIGK
jgi:hypothetical protein